MTSHQSTAQCLSRWFLGAWAWALLFAAVSTLPLTAQQEPRQAQATRAELESSLTEIDQILASPAYSTSLKARKRAEATMIRERLRDGDFQVGDQLKVELSVGVTTTTAPINGTFPVGPGQVLKLPDLPDIPLHGVLRSEAPEYLTQYLNRFFKDQTVKVTPMIRLAILGGVRNPGFFQLPSETTMPDAIMAAGGPSPGSEMERSTLERGTKELWPKKVVYAAITGGTTLDQLNLRAGDVLTVGTPSTMNLFSTLRTAAIIPGLILGFYGLGKLVGIF